MHRGTSEQPTGTTCISTISGSTMAVDPFPQLLDRYPSPCYNHINITVTALWVATPFLSTVSVAAVCVAVSTNQWLLTQESIKNDNYTGRGENEYFPKNTVSGLWTLCYTNPGKQDFFCSNIEYFPREEYSPDLKDSTMAIPYTVTKSAAFFILSTFLLFVGELCCLFGHFSRQRRLFTFISGVVFIISGLLMLIGLVMYISIFKAEVGGKLRPTSQLQPAVFTYKYGYSFILYVAGFVSTEISGTCAVFLYIYWHQKEWRRKGHQLRTPNFVSLDVDPVYRFCRRHPHNLSANSVAAFPPPPPNNLTPNLHPHRRLYLHHHSDTPDDDDDEHASAPLDHPLASLTSLHRPFPSLTSLHHSTSCNAIDTLPHHCPPPPLSHFPHHCPSPPLSHFPHHCPSPPPSHLPHRRPPPPPSHLPHHCPPSPPSHLPHHCPPSPPSHLPHRRPPSPPSHLPHHSHFLAHNSSPRDASTNTTALWEDRDGDDEDEDDCSSTLHDHHFVPFDLDEGPTPVPPVDESAHFASSTRRDEIVFETLSKTTPV